MVRVGWRAEIERIDYTQLTRVTVGSLYWVSDGEQEESESIFK